MHVVVVCCSTVISTATTDTNQANELIESLENEKDLNNSAQSYQQLLKLNNIIEKKFQKSFKSINEYTNKKVREIRNKNEKKA